MWLLNVSLSNCLQIIMLSASANKLSRLKEQAEEYAALIMEELDPEGLGYIEVSSLCFFCDGRRSSIQWNNIAYYRDVDISGD